jgi:oxygen-independent coproporphyrinogen-3 oxidase
MEFEAPGSLYIHIPVCTRKCSYCDFFSLPAASFSDSFLDHLVEATIARAEVLADRFGSSGFSTVYVGGGTPTALGGGIFDRLLAGISRIAPSPIEWTVEANPESLGMQHIESMLRHGVTRVSIGVQSLNDEELLILGRLHDSGRAVQAVRAAADSGLVVSIDLIAGVPWFRYCSRPSTALSDTALTLIDAGVSHFSVYDLTLEEGTPLARDTSMMNFSGEETLCAERSALDAVLALNGIRRYEVSNYAARGMECRHNLVYWRMGSYIGAGPGAVSTLVAKASDSARAGVDGASLRIEEHKEIERYREDRGGTSIETTITPRDAAFEEIMMGFRTIFGLDTGLFQARFGIEADSLIAETLRSWRGRIVPGEVPPGGCGSRGPALNYEGMDLLNRFLGDCLAELEKKFPAGCAAARNR